MGKQLYKTISMSFYEKSLKKSIIVKMGKKWYDTDYRFRRVLCCLKLLEDTRLSDWGKVRGALRLLLSPFSYIKALYLSPKEQGELLHILLSRLTGPEHSSDRNGEGGREKLVCLFRDSGRIYSAFLSCYHMDLRKENPHWFLFLELLASLPKTTRLYEIMGIRAAPIPVPNGNNSEEIRRLSALKQKYSLHDDGSYHAQLDDLFSKLEQNGK